MSFDWGWNSVRVSILGAGGWGRNHVRTFCALLGAEAVWVCDPDGERRKEMDTAYPGVCLADRPIFEGVDAAVIAAPAALHYALAVEAIDAGLHVLVEKPLALSPADALDLVRRADEAGTVLMVDHLLEYHPAVERLKAAIDAGRLGTPLHVASQRLNLGVVRTEENALWSLAPHDISIILYLLGEDPFEVAAHGAAYLQPGIADVAQLTLRFESGVFGRIDASWLDPIKTRRLTVVGDRAMAVFDDVSDEKLVFHDKRAEARGDVWTVHRGEASPEPIESGEPLSCVANAFLDAIRTGEAPRTDGRDGLRVVRVLDAAQRSMDSGGRPVALEEQR